MDLCGVKIIRQPVEHGPAGKFRQHFGVVLAETALLDSIVDTAQNPRGVFHRFLVANLAARWPQIGDVRTLIVGCDLKTASGAGSVLLED